jgi:hypothetical protein
MKFLLFLIFTPLFSVAQISWQEAFSSHHNFSSSSWKGDTSQFQIDTLGQLRLNADASSGNRQLYRSSTIKQNAEWTFSIKLDFNPSSSNYAKLFLWADANNSQNIQNGVFIRVGGDTDDRLSLIELNQGVESILIQSPVDFLDKNENELRIRINLDSLNYYNLYVDSSDWKGSSWQSLGSAFSFNPTASSYFIIECRHTSTRSDKFYFDDIEAKGVPFEDREAPLIQSWHSNPNRTLELIVNEKLDSLEVLDPGYFQLSPYSYRPELIEYFPQENRLLLSYPQSNSYKAPLYLHISSLADLFGNELDTAIGPFHWNSASWRDILITEVLADPEPIVGLLNAEGLELCNMSDLAIDLSQWKLQTSTKELQLDSMILLASTCIWLTDIGNCGDIENCLELDWPSHFLPNESENLRLYQWDEELIDRINYSNEDFQHSIKASGGWSLEKSFSSSCPELDEWTESSEAMGGSPGEWNSILSIDTNESIVQTQISKHSFLQSNQLLFTWSKPILNIDSLSILIDGYQVDSIFLSPTSEEELLVFLPFSIKADVQSEIQIQGSVQFCGGHTQIDTALEINLPIPQRAQLWTFTEILYAPGNSDAPEFIEIMNNSNRHSEIAGLRICKRMADGDWDCSDPIEERQIISPSELLLISSEEFEDYRPIGNTKSSSLVLESFPSLNDQGETIYILDSTLSVIAETRYDPNMQSELLASDNGHSLCRNPLESSHWHSSTEIGGNPGEPCRHFKSEREHSIIKLSSECLSPNGDGWQDEIQIEIHSEFPSSLAFLEVYDLNGRSIAQLLSHTFIGRKHLISWNGYDAKGSRLSVGTYFLKLELENENGDVKKSIDAFSVCQ